MPVGGSSNAKYFSHTTFFPAATPCTLMCWTRYNTVPGTGYTSHMGQASGASGALVVGTLNGNLNLGTRTADFSGSALPAGVWTHLTLVMADSTARRVYRNGRLEISASDSDGSVELIFFNWRTGFTESPDADVCYFKVWGAALTDAEIAREMWSPGPVRRGNLLGDFPMLDTALDIVDMSGNNRTLTKSGTFNTVGSPPIQARIAPVLGSWPWWVITAGGGDITVTDVAALLAQVADPSVVLGSVSVTDVAQLLAQVVDPTALLGSISLTDTTTLVAQVADPTTVLTSVIVTDAATLAALVQDPTALLGTLTLTDVAQVSVVVADPLTILGSLSVTDAAQLVAVVADPNVTDTAPVIVTDVATLLALVNDPVASIHIAPGRVNRRVWGFLGHAQINTGRISRRVASQ